MKSIRSPNLAIQTLENLKAKENSEILDITKTALNVIFYTVPPRKLRVWMMWNNVMMSGEVTVPVFGSAETGPVTTCLQFGTAFRHRLGQLQVSLTYLVCPFAREANQSALKS